MKAVLVELWTYEPYAFPLYNASRHGDREVRELEMNMAVAAQRVVGGQSVWIPNTIGHTNTFNEFLREELKARRDESLGNVAIDGGRRERAIEAARKAKEEWRPPEKEMAEEKEGAAEKAGLEWKKAKGKVKVDEDALAKMRQQLGFFD